MSEADIANLQLQVLGAGFGVGALLGWVGQRSHFCVMGAVADAVTMGSLDRARQWALAVAVAVLGFALLGSLGWVQPAQTLHGSSRLLWASHLVGGLMFGVGMVFASGCGGRTLIRAGGGNLKAWVVLVVMGLTGFMTMRGITAVLRTQTVDRLSIELGGGQDLPSLLGLPALPVAAAVTAALLVFACWGARSRARWVGGLGVGALVTLAWALTSHWAFVPEHPQTLEAAWVATSFNRPEAFSFVAPSAGLLDWLLFYSDASKRLNFGVCSLIGVLVGAAAAALAAREFRWEGFRQTDDLVKHLIGASLMGVGGVTAMGCTFGQGITGVSTLSVGSLLTVVGLVSGAWLTLQWQLRRA